MIHILFLVFLSSCMIREGHYIPDNPIEEIVEGIIKREIDVDVDLSPATPEKELQAPKRPSRVFVPQYPDQERPRIWFCLMEF